MQIEDDASPSDATSMPTRAGAIGGEGLSRLRPIEAARFPPGRIFASRYRIVSLLGRGAMGEVYRADDLKLGQRVALKLLSRGSSGGTPPHRFVAEARLAREIAHPNVCRVYDIGEADGWHYLSMEYVDGETLASLLRRIGALPSEKALDVARQLCAGLAAAHERGVLHRDLKPSNIMVDGRGQVRIVDLGLATPIRDAVEEVVGTPAYMVPEQLAGGRVSERTDLYALGLVLYETFTGRRLFPVSTVDERVLAADAGSIALAKMSGIHPAVDDAIRRCLERDPGDRPRSAWELASLLPGGDPLAAALAAGRMPSPEMVAAAGKKGAVRPAIAWALLLTIVAGTLGVASRVASVTQTGPDRLPKPPEVLAERARNLLSSVGFDAAARDVEFWFEPDPVALSVVSGFSRTSAIQSASPAAAHAENPFPIRFVYRQSADSLVPQNSMHVVMESDPPGDAAGLATVVLDPGGRLLHVKAVSAGDDASIAGRRDATRTVSDLFAEAGLDPHTFAPVTGKPPPVPHDVRTVWEQPLRERDPLRVTAATLDGRPVYFDVSRVDALPVPRQTWFSRGARSKTNEALLVGFSLALFIGGGILARRNVRLGYGDTRGARRLAILIATGGVVWAALRAHHVPLPVEEWVFLLVITGWSLVWAGFAWLTYISLEPYMRRWWPHTLISWARLLSGRVRDPLVGRDLLVGLVAGMVFVTLFILRVEVARLLGIAVRPLDQSYSLEGLRSIRYFIGLVVYFALDTLNFSLGALGILLLVRLIVRNAWVSGVIWVIILASVNMVGGMFVWDVSFALAMALLSIAVLMRFGLVSSAVMLLYTDLMTRLPVTLDMQSWYIALSVLTLLLIAALATYGFAIALAGQPAFGEQVGPVADSKWGRGSDGKSRN